MVLRQLQVLYNECLEQERKVLRLSFQGKFEEAEVELRKRDRMLAQIKSMNTLHMAAPQFKAEYEDLERKRSMLIG
jgi:aminopeptidase C